MINNKYKISIFNHHQDGTTDATQHLLDYLVTNNKIESLVNVRFPFLVSNTGQIEVRFFKSNQKKPLYSKVSFYQPEILSYLKDFIYAIYYGIKFCCDSDLFFGSPNLLVLAGIILKKIGYVKKVIYYTIDYTPVRFKNRLIDWIYFQIDKFVCYNSDEVWSLNREMIYSRIKDHHWDSKKMTIKIVPFGNHSDRFKDNDYKNYEKNTVVYFGGISQDKGASLFIPIAKELLDDTKNNIKFLIIGGGKVDELRKEIKKSGLKKYFEVTGPISDHREIENRLIKCGVALAPYYPDNKNNFSYYSDPGKVKEYLGCGLPIVITAVPPISSLIQNESAGYISRYDASDFSKKINDIISDNDRYKKFRNNAISLGRKYSWNKIFDAALANLVV